MAFRHINLAPTTFAAVHVMGRDNRTTIRQAVRQKVKALGLKPARRKHSTKFKDSDLNVTLEGGKKKPIEFTVGVADILAWIENVCQPVEGGNEADNKYKADACEKLCKLYVLTA